MRAVANKSCLPHIYGRFRLILTEAREKTVTLRKEKRGWLISFFLLRSELWCKQLWRFQYAWLHWIIICFQLATAALSKGTALKFVALGKQLFAFHIKDKRSRGNRSNPEATGVRLSSVENNCSWVVYHFEIEEIYPRKPDKEIYSSVISFFFPFFFIFWRGERGGRN